MLELLCPRLESSQPLSCFAVGKLSYALACGAPSCWAEGEKVRVSLWKASVHSLATDTHLARRTIPLQSQTLILKLLLALSYSQHARLPAP